MLLALDTTTSSHATVTPRCVTPRYAFITAMLVVLFRGIFDIFFQILPEMLDKPAKPVWLKSHEAEKK